MKEITIKVTRRKAGALNCALSDFIFFANNTLKSMEREPQKFAILGKDGIKTAIQDQKLFLKELCEMSKSIDKQTNKLYPRKD